MKAKLLQALAATALPACVLATGAQAHTPSPTPADVAPRPGSMVTADAAFAHAFFVPGVAFDHGRSSVRGPDRRDTALEPAQVPEARSVAEHRLAGPGTTGSASTADRRPLLLTGVQGGATFHLARAGSFVALVGYRSAAPAGAEAPERSHGDTRGFRVLQQ